MKWSSKNSIDYIFFFITIFLVSFGVIMVFSSSMVLANYRYGDCFYFLKRHLIWVLLGMFSLLIFSKIDFHKLKLKFISIPFLALSILFLFLVLFPGVGKSVGGARRWLTFGAISFQPSEMAKLALIIFIARTMPQRIKKFDNFFYGLFPYLFIFGIICFLILKEPDLGTTIVISFTFYGMLFVSGVKKKYLLLLGFLGIISIFILILIAPYRFERFISFFNLNDDLIKTDYQSHQSILAIGSGGLKGVGLGKSAQKFLYLPQPHTDFIFAIICEELGFIGSFGVVIFFLLFTLRGLRISFLSSSLFGSLLSFGIVSQISLQSLLNIAVVCGCLPVTGIPLPFLSLGGSSLFFTLTGIGIVLNISKNLKENK